MTAFWPVAGNEALPGYPFIPSAPEVSSHIPAMPETGTPHNREVRIGVDRRRRAARDHQGVWAAKKGDPVRTGGNQSRERAWTCCLTF